MRLKIIAGNLAVVLVVGLVSYLMVREDLRTGLASQLDSTIGNDVTLFDRSYRLSAQEFLTVVEDRARSRPARDVFAGLDVSSRRTRAFEFAESVSHFMKDPARGRSGSPDFVAVTDETGSVVARNGGRNLMFGASMRTQLPALAKSLNEGQLQHDAWFDAQENKVLQIGIAPIRADDGTTLGALVVGYDLSNGVAAREARVLGRDVAFIVQEKVYSASLGGETMRALNQYLHGTEKSTTSQVLTGAVASSQAWRTQLLDDDYIGVTAALPLSPSLPIAYAVLGNRTKQMALASSADTILYLLMIGVLLVVAYGFVIGTNLLREIERIEEGVLAVINGKTDLRLETDDSAELGGLAYRINQLLNVFTGTAEDTEDDHGRVSRAPDAGAWRDKAFDEASAGSAAGDGGSAAAGSDVIEDETVARQLAAEEEVAYYERVYNEYVSAKRSVGENVSNIPQERFVQRLKGNEGTLTKKHGCRMVRFQVQTRGNQVVLRPVIIR